MHNSFDVEKLEDGKFRAVSHNFKDAEGIAETEQGAIESMIRAVLYIRDNDNVRFKLNYSERIKNGLKCCCGEKLDGDVLAVKM